MEKTEWHPADIKPVHIGLYECDREEFSGRVIRFLYWDGRQWFYTETSGVHTAGGYASLCKSDNDMWRGLKENPHAD